MANLLFSNNARSSLNEAITNSATTITLTNGDGNLFPVITGSDFFFLTLAETNSSGTEIAWENLKCTARSGDVLTVVRGQEGTTGTAWPSGTPIELRVTAESLEILGTPNVSQETFRLTSTTDASETSTGHAFQIGPDSGGTKIKMDSAEINAYNGTSTSTLNLNNDGGNVKIGDWQKAANLQVENDITALADMFIGRSNSTNIQIDSSENEINAFDNGSASTLGLNSNGGNVKIGDGQNNSNLQVEGTITTISGTVNGRNTATDGAKLDGIAASANNYTLPSDIATQAYVGTQLSSLVDSSPATLNTLNELAAALGDDPNFATTVTNSIGTKWTQDNTKISNWDTAYGWGNHANAGYLTTYVDTTYTIGDGGLTQKNFTTALNSKLDGIATNANNYSLPFTDNSTNWNTAFGWGNHSSAGYLTSVVAASVDSASATAKYVLTADGAGNATWGESTGGLSWVYAATMPTTALANRGYFAAGGQSTLMPLNPDEGTNVAFSDLNDEFDTSPLTLNGNGETFFQGTDTQYILDLKGTFAEFSFLNGYWRLINFGRLSNAYNGSSGGSSGGAFTGGTISGSDVTLATGIELITQTLGAGNFRAGVDAGSSITSAGGSNTFVGDESGKANTSGGGNSGFGYRALKSSTTGNNNSAFGYQAMQSNLTGFANVAGGVQALAFNTTGANNVAIGYRALYSNVSGNGNSSFGYESLKANTTGGDNVALGYSTLKFNTTGLGNVAIGGSVLSSNTTGNYNTAVGKSALNSNTTAGYGTAFGYFALGSNTSGAFNTAFGINVLKENTTGQNNSASGSQSMVANTTGRYNSAFGAQTLGANTTSDSNSAFGYQALKDNTTGTENSAAGREALLYNLTGSGNVAHGFRSLRSSAGSNNTATGHQSGYSLTTGALNTFSGKSSGYYITTGNKNSILGSFDGNEGGLDIRTSSNNIVLSDGDGNPRLHIDGSGAAAFTGEIAANGGIDVTGTATMDALTTSGTIKIDSATPALWFYENDATDLNGFIRNVAGDLLIQTINDAGSAVNTRLSVDHATGDVSLYDSAGTTPKLFWDASAESLGIGTSSPSSALDVVGTVTMDGLILDQTTNSISTGTSDGSDNARLFLNGGGSPSINRGGNVSVYGNEYSSSGGNVVLAAGDALTGGAVEGHIRMLTGPSRNRLLIDDNGDLSLYESAGTTPKFFWDSSAESLGIGTVSPSALLHVKDGNNSILLDGRTDGGNVAGTGAANISTIDGIYASNTIPGARIAFAHQGSAGQRGGLTFASKDTDDSSNQPTVRGVLTPAGLWGFGTANPTSTVSVAGTLDVTGTTTGSGYLYLSSKTANQGLRLNNTTKIQSWNPAGNVLRDLMELDANEDVRIGSSANPIYLDNTTNVTGSIKVSGNIFQGTNPATAGDIRMAATSTIRNRNAANTNNIHMIGTNTSDEVSIASSGQATVVGGDLSVSGTTTGTGGFNLPNNTPIRGVPASGGTVRMLRLNTSNQVEVGSTNDALRFTSTSSTFLTGDVAIASGRLNVNNGGSAVATPSNVQAVVSHTDGFANAGLAIVSGTGNSADLFLGDTTNPKIGYVSYANAGNKMSLGVSAGTKFTMTTTNAEFATNNLTKLWGTAVDVKITRGNSTSGRVDIYRNNGNNPWSIVGGQAGVTLDLELDYMGVRKGDFNSTTGDYTPLSLRKFKDNIEDVVDPYEIIRRLRPRTYSMSGVETAGYIYDEVDGVLDRASMDAGINHRPVGVNHNVINTYTTAAVQRLIVASEAAAEEIAQLKADIQELRGLLP